MSAEDPSVWAKIAAGATAGLSALVGVLWQDNKKRVEKCERHIEKLYSNAEDDRRTVRDLHDKAMDAIGASERRIIDAIHTRFPGRN